MLFTSSDINPSFMDGNKHLTPANAQLSLSLSLSSNLWVKRSEFELIWHESSSSLAKLNSIVEKGANVNISGMKVPRLKMGKSELSGTLDYLNFG